MYTTKGKALGIKFHFSFPIDPDSLDALLSNFLYFLLFFLGPIPRDLVKCPQFSGLFAPYSSPNRISDLTSDRSNCLSNGHLWPRTDGLWLSASIEYSLGTLTLTLRLGLGLADRAIRFRVANDDFLISLGQNQHKVFFKSFSGSSPNLLFTLFKFLPEKTALFCMLICLSYLSRGHLAGPGQ